MALAIAYEDAKTSQVRKEADVSKGTTGGAIDTQFFGSRGISDLPQAALTQRDPGKVSPPHFHIVDQFQVIVDGKGKLGRHDLTPYCVHFARAYTPYGPLVSDADAGLTFFALRAHYDPGAQRLSKARDKLKQVPDRQPWQITRPLTFPALVSGTGPANIMLQAVPDIKDDQGLAAYTLSMKPNTKTYAPDPSDGDGQYLVVIKGSLLHDNKKHKAWALVFVYPEERAFQIQAGSEGLEAMIFNFPRAKARAAAGTAS